MNSSGIAVYAVTQGRYSDWRIHSVWSSMEKAVAMRDLVANQDSEVNDTISVWYVDELEPFVSQGYKPFMVYLARNGDLLAIHQLPIECGYHGDEMYLSPVSEKWNHLTSAWQAGPFSYYNGTVEKSESFRIGLRMEVVAKDEAHAVKIAGDRRRQFIADGRWEPEVQRTREWAKRYGHTLAEEDLVYQGLKGI